MTMLSFRADDSLAARADEAARRLGVDRSQLLRQALRRHLDRLAAQDEAARYAARPLSDEELGIARIAEWGPAEDWSDWSDAQG